MREISKEMRAQKVQERKLTQELLEAQQGLCAECGRWPDWRGLSKHEIVYRSDGGDATDKNNCVLLCGDCHMRVHGLRVGK